MVQKTGPINDSAGIRTAGDAAVIGTQPVRYLLGKMHMLKRVLHGAWHGAR